MLQPVVVVDTADATNGYQSIPNMSLQETTKLARMIPFSKTNQDKNHYKKTPCNLQGWWRKVTQIVQLSEE